MHTHAHTHAHTDTHKRTHAWPRPPAWSRPPAWPRLAPPARAALTLGSCMTRSSASWVTSPASPSARCSGVRPASSCGGGGRERGRRHGRRHGRGSVGWRTLRRRRAGGWRVAGTARQVAGGWQRVEGGRGEGRQATQCVKAGQCAVPRPDTPPPILSSSGAIWAAGSRSRLSIAQHLLHSCGTSASGKGRGQHKAGAQGGPGERPGGRVAVGAARPRAACARAPQAPWAAPCTNSPAEAAGGPHPP